MLYTILILFASITFTFSAYLLFYTNLMKLLILLINLNVYFTLVLFTIVDLNIKSVWLTIK